MACAGLDLFNDCMRRGSIEPYPCALRYLKQISNQAVVRDLEDGGLGVLIDGYDDLGVLHTRQMLDGTWDTNSYVQLLEMEGNLTHCMLEFT